MFQEARRLPDYAFGGAGTKNRICRHYRATLTIYCAEREIVFPGGNRPPEKSAASFSAPTRGAGNGICREKGVERGSVAQILYYRERV